MPDTRPLSRCETEMELNRLEARMAALLQVTRDSNHILREYDRDKYGALLERQPTTIAETLVHEAASRVMRWTCGDRFYESPLIVLREVSKAYLHRQLERFPGEAYCELGAGYGYHLDGLSNSYGGELTSNGVQLGRKLGLDLVPFDFYRPDDYRLLRPKTTVFTSAAIEQLPSAVPFVDNLLTYRDRITYIVNLEPTRLAQRFGKLGELRNQYTTRNDYNVDLFHLLLSRPEVELVAFDQDIVGANPLNPLCLFAWRFRA